MKSLIVTDTHIGHHKASEHNLEVVKTLFKEICDHATTNGIKRLFHLGDFFDNRKSISIRALRVTLEIREMLEQTFDSVYMIVGNHDIYYKDTLDCTAHLLFKGSGTISVVTERQLVDDILLVPWILPTDDVNFPDAKYCFGHFEINGAILNRSGTKDENSALSFSDFSRFDLVLSGHYHTIGEYPHNVKYIGAPYHMSFNDEGSRGFYELEGGVLDFVEYNSAPKYIIYNARKGDVIDPDLLRGNVVKVVFKEDFGSDENGKIVQIVNGTEPFRVFVEYKFTTNTDAGNIGEDVSLKEHKDVHIDYVDKIEIPETLSRDIVNSIIESLYELEV